MGSFCEVCPLLIIDHIVSDLERWLLVQRCQLLTENMRGLTIWSTICFRCHCSYISKIPMIKGKNVNTEMDVVSVIHSFRIQDTFSINLK